MDIFGILDPDPHENLCGSETLVQDNVWHNFKTSVILTFYVYDPIILTSSLMGCGTLVTKEGTNSGTSGFRSVAFRGQLSGSTLGRI